MLLPLDRAVACVEDGLHLPRFGGYLMLGATVMVRIVSEDKNEQKILDDVAMYGWHCVNIFAEPEQPQYSFTVGLFHSYRHPELIIFGLAPKIAHQILGIVANAAKSGQPLDLSQPSDALVNDYLCCFAPVPTSEYHEHVGFCRWFYGDNDFPLYQVLWPSRAGLFPWHPQATPEFRTAQPVIAAHTDGT